MQVTIHFRALRALFYSVFLFSCLFASAALADDPPKDGAVIDMAAMMEKAKAYTQPGPHHDLLKRFLGTWDTEFRVTLSGSQTPAEKGTATFSWLIEGRWIQQQSTGSVMGNPTQGFMIIGYDNLKMSYATVTVGNVDTAMLTAEGDLDPTGKALITYGTLDEYLTGEHDKMVKYVWRFVSDDKLVFEVHDLPIGESNTKVVEITYNRRKG